MIGKEEIENRFGFHKATIAERALVRKLFKRFMERLDEILADGRAKSVASTNLEDASMWSHKAIAERAPLVEERD